MKRAVFGGGVFAVRPRKPPCVGERAGGAILYEVHDINSKARTKRKCARNDGQRMSLSTYNMAIVRMGKWKETYEKYGVLCR